MAHTRPCLERRLIRSLAATAAAACLFAGATAAAGDPADIRFVPGVYYLDDYVQGAPVAAPTDTLTVVVSGGMASFTLSGADNATFSVPDPSVPTGTDIDDDGLFNPYYQIQTSAISTSWDVTAYPWLTFWSAEIGGGVTAGSIPGDFGSNLFDTSGSTIGPSQVFAVPEPETWMLLLTGVAALGAALRRPSARSPSSPRHWYQIEPGKAAFTDGPRVANPARWTMTPRGVGSDGLADGSPAWRRWRGRKARDGRGLD